MATKVFNIVGITPTTYDFSDKQTGAPVHVEGMTFHMSRKADKGTGVEVHKEFLSAAKVEKLDYLPGLNDRVELLYNQYGKVRDFRLHSEK